MSHFKGPDVPHLHFRSTTSVLELLHKALKSNGEETALVEGETGSTISYSEILQQSGCIAAGLRSRGVTAGEVVVVCCEKSILACSALLGVMFTGATVALVPTPNADIIPQLTKGHAVKAIIYDADNQESVSKSVAVLTPRPSLVVPTNPHDAVMASLLNCPKDVSFYEVPDPMTHRSIILYSSGTTGVPKGVELTDATLQMAAAPGHGMIKVQLSTSPLYWTSGLFLLLAALLHKRLLVMSNSTDAKLNLQLTVQYQVESWFVGVGTMQRLTYEYSKQPFDLSSLKRIFAGGETLLEHPTTEFIETVLKDKLKVDVLYGSSEAGILTHNNNHKLVDSYKVVSSGKVLPGTEIKIVGDDGEIVPLGSLGELWVRSVNMTTGYWNKPELNDQLFDDRFLQTGDIGHFDEDGNLYVLGRVADTILYQGSKMIPTAVENELMSHAGVLEAAVVCVSPPSPTTPPRLESFIVLKPGAQVSRDQLLAFLDGKVELTGGIHFLNALPRTVIGKTVRRKLREAVLD